MYAPSDAGVLGMIKCNQLRISWLLVSIKHKQEECKSTHVLHVLVQDNRSGRVKECGVDEGDMELGRQMEMTCLIVIMLQAVHGQNTNKNVVN